MTGARWVVVGENCFRCLRCDARHDLQMPVSIPALVKKANAFEALHEDCPAKAGVP